MSNIPEEQRPHFVMCASPTGQEFTHMWKYFKQQSSILQSKRTHSRYMLRKKYMNLVLHCRNVQKNYWLHLHSQRACQSHLKKKLLPHKITVVHKLYRNDNEARLNFVNWYCHALHDGEIDPTLLLIRGKAWFHLGELMNSQTKKVPHVNNWWIPTHALFHIQHCISLECWF